MTDLEILSKTVSDDSTVLLAKLIESQGDKNGLLDYLSYCEDKELISKIRRFRHVSHKQEKRTSSKDNPLRCRIKRWKSRLQL